MQEGSFSEVIEKIREKDPRFEVEAYFFVREALDYTSRVLEKPTEGTQRHISGEELLEGIRAYAIQEYGPMAFRVLKSWGINQSGDFGGIVFNLVDGGVLGKTDEDKKEDFAGGYDFQDAFVKPFQPKSKTRQKNPKTRKKTT